MIQFPGFEKVDSVPGELIERYRGRVPDDMLTIWQTHGFGTAVNGFIKIVDPDDTAARIAESLPVSTWIPLFATGLGDIIAWTGENLRDVKYRYGTVRGLGSKIKTLPVYLGEDEFLRDWFEWEPYEEAVALHGALGFDECFGYVPLLALGGPEKADHLQKVKLVEHVNLITQLAGPIDY